jgi:hypothetical protein
MIRRYIWRRGLCDGVAIAQIISLQSTSPAGFMATIIRSAAQKLCYALNHFCWTVKSPWRFNNAMSEVVAAAGILLLSVGIEFLFYGRRSRDSQ